MCDPNKANAAAHERSGHLPGSAVFQCSSSSIELFRGGKTLESVPFATTDNAIELDFAIPDDKHGIQDYTQDGIVFPQEDTQDGRRKCNEDDSLFRICIRNLPQDTPDEIQSTLKVLTSNGLSIKGRSSSTYKNCAVHPDGMKITLKKNNTEWISSYLRIATTFTDLSQSNPLNIVHSLSPNYQPQEEREPVQGNQFGRILKVTCNIGEIAISKYLFMGEKYFATIPVQFKFVGPSESSRNRLETIAHDRIATLNAYWAGKGLQFKLADRDKPIEWLYPPNRNLIVINEHTGKDTVADHAIRVVIVCKIDSTPQNPITIDIDKNMSLHNAAARIKKKIESAHSKLKVDVYEFSYPRIQVACDYSRSPATSQIQQEQVGNCGPTDIVISSREGKSIDVTELRAYHGQQNEAGNSVDIYCPPVSEPFIDPNFNPVSAAHRHWIRNFQSQDHIPKYISVVVAKEFNSKKYSDLCEENFSTIDRESIDQILTDRDIGSTTSPVSILNFDRWNEPSARFIVFLKETDFCNSCDTVPHEIGHTLADCDHVPIYPESFYGPELMHASGPIKSHANKMTKHKVYVTSVRKKDDGTWETYLKACPNGYGGEARARIKKLAPGWLRDSHADPKKPFMR